MSKALVEMAYCGVCGVDVRDESQFCYNCGFRFADLSGPARTSEDGAVSVQPEPAGSNRIKRNAPVRKIRKGNAGRQSAATGALTSGFKKRNALANIYVRATQSIKPLSPERRFLFIAAAFAAVSLVLIVLALYLR